MKNNDGKIIIFVTAASTSEASKIGKTLVKERIAACCNIIPGVQSIYWWEEKVCEDAEVMLMIKTTRSAEQKAMETIKSLHSYDIPEMITINMDGGSEKYLKWIDDSVKL